MKIVDNLLILPYVSNLRLKVFWQTIPSIHYSVSKIKLAQVIRIVGSHGRSCPGAAQTNNNCLKLQRTMTNFLIALAFPDTVCTSKSRGMCKLPTFLPRDAMHNVVLTAIVRRPFVRPSVRHTSVSYRKGKRKPIVIVLSAW